MDRRSFTLILTFLVTILFTHPGERFVCGATFTFVNRCGYTVWPGILAGSGSPRLETTGFELPAETSRAIAAPTGWSGRFWGRTGCTFPGSCLTADCGSGTEECNGAGAAPPATLAEFTLGSGGGRDFYDVSLVDGYNVQMLIEGAGGAGACAATGCSADINERCPAELRAGSGGACMSACGAFGSAEYCCSGAYGSPATCRPSVYSEMFKAACPRSYSYAYDDASSTFTCIGADYTITFCPSSTSSQKRDTTTTPTPPGTSQGSVPGSGMGYSGMGDGSQPGFTNPGSDSGFTNPGSDSGFTNSGSQPGFTNSGSGSGFSYSGSGGIPGTETKGTIMPDGSWLAGLAMGSSPATLIPSVQSTLILTASVFSMLLIFSLRKL